MSEQNRIVAPTFPYDMVRLEDGTKTKPPEGWALLKPGDATLTRRVKAAGPSWTVQEKKGRKTFSHGVWAPAHIIERETQRREAEKASPAYQRRLAADRARRAKKQEEYAEDFETAVFDYLDFHSRYLDLARTMAAAIAAHATPVGSGTVARTKRIPIEERAAAATIAWMRHQTTAYDDMQIARVKGRRREVRRELAQRSKTLLQRYRQGRDTPERCPLKLALAKLP
ncbi:DUF2293 domain-containing protein [Lujinxingia litoralis]|uniref:DUF2293 domain-containing protein n=1 Tax=Lujinxingia litoralis TaxID=2211119 RepID=A0A328C2T4_9DELT|nr:DUF2293 domain-containing protein [Lujinxingia litoralis]RAL20111.1 DUF2293 domain-containing protein [Lujinxingia litoralis]